METIWKEQNIRKTDLKEFKNTTTTTTIQQQQQCESIK